MRTRTDFDLEQIQREAQLRRLGRDLHEQAAAISSETVDAMAAVVSRLDAATDYGTLVAEGFGEAMVSDAGVRHLTIAVETLAEETSPGGRPPRSP